MRVVERRVSYDQTGCVTPRELGFSIWFKRSVIAQIIESVGLSIAVALLLFCWRTSQIRCFFWRR